MRNLVVLALCVIVIQRIALADDAPPPAVIKTDDKPAIAIHGLVDVDYAYNGNRPADGGSFMAGIGSTAKRANEATLNLAAAMVSMPPAPVGFNVELVYGTATEIEHSAEPLNPDVWRVVQRASVTYQNGPVSVEAGIYPSHIGFEAFYSKDDWTYTRSFSTEFTPFYQAGVKLAYAFNDRLSGQIHVVNGWGTIGDTNQMKSFGTQLAWTDGALNLAWNTWAGPELAGDDDDWRFFNDLVAVVPIGKKLSIAAQLDAGLQQRPAADTATWLAGQLYVRYTATPALAFTVRGEVFHDPDAVLSLAPTVGSVTMCGEYRPVPNLILKLEGRYDRADGDVFGAHDMVMVDDEALAIVGAVATF